MTTPPDEIPRQASRGRPSKEEARLLRDRILRSALAAFLEEGYAGSSIEAIARRAGVSRTTIYALYTDKVTLFTELIRHTVRGTDISRRVDFDDRPPRIVLGEAMRVLNKAYFREPNMEVLRLCIAEADRFPELFDSVRSLLGATLVTLTTYFARLRDEGTIAVDDPQRTAFLFNLLCIGSLRPFFIHQRRLTEADMTGHLDLALDIFLNGCLARPAPAERG